MMEVIDLLQAKLNNGKLITLFEFSKQEIEVLRSDHVFICPACKGRVIIKSGSKIIPHFAHQNRKNCQTHEGGEGVYHEQGKVMLYQWLVKQGLDVSLEEYISSIKQRCDIFLRVGKKKIALEYQCARIPIKEIQKRTRSYLRVGIQPIWILGANHLKRSAKHSFKVDQFLLQFLHQFQDQTFPIIYFFDPHSKLFTIIGNLFQTGKRRMIGDFIIKKLDSMIFLDMFKMSVFSKELFLTEWRKAKYRYRMYQPKKLYGTELSWYNWLYYKGTHREFLPSIIYLPISSQYRMLTSLWDWQSRICLGFIDPIPIGAVFSLNSCHFQFRKSISSDLFPLLQPLADPILEYLHLLCSLGIIEQVSEHQFRKSKNLHHYPHIEDALKGDEELLKELLNIFETKYEHDS